MCSPKSKPQGSNNNEMNHTLSDINGRPVLQPNCNRTPLLERRNSLKKSTTNSSNKPLPPLSSSSPAAASTTITSSISINSHRVRAPLTTTPPASPKLKSPRQPATKRGNDPNGLTSSVEKLVNPRSTTKSSVSSVKKSKKSNSGGGGNAPNNSTDNSSSSSSLKYSSSLIVEAPGSIAAARREQVAIMQVQRKMRIAHYGRTKSAKYEGKIIPLDSSVITTTVKGEKRCNFITSNSDPVYIAYHDEEWGVPVHDDKLIFELLVLTGAQVGSVWTTVLKKRQDFRDAFSGFDAEIVAKFTEKKMTSICTDYGIELSQVRGAVDNANRIVEIKKEFDSFGKYLWAFVNHKPIATQYKSCLKIPVKTSKSESISKAMVRRGFRYVGPTVIHSFMQAAGLTNDHLTTCPRHLQCLASASQSPVVAPAL